MGVYKSYKRHFFIIVYYIFLCYSSWAILPRKVTVFLTDFRMNFLLNYDNLLYFLNFNCLQLAFLQINTLSNIVMDKNLFRKVSENSDNFFKLIETISRLLLKSNDLLVSFTKYLAIRCFCRVFLSCYCWLMNINVQWYFCNMRR
jgi:hypothetical protein